MALAADGDADAFARIYDLTAGVVFGYLLASHLDDPEDRLRGAYLRYWTQLPVLTDRSRSYAVRWLVLAASDLRQIRPERPVVARAISTLDDGLPAS